MYISGGNVANYVCYFAQTGDNGTQAISAFIVPDGLARLLGARAATARWA